MQRRLLPRRPSQILDRNINFVFTGTGTALDIQHTLLLFLADSQEVWTSDLIALSQDICQPFSGDTYVAAG